MFWRFLSYLEFREEFPYVVNKKVNWQCTTVNCNENPLDGYYGHHAQGLLLPVAIGPNGSTLEKRSVEIFVKCCVSWLLFVSLKLPQSCFY